MGKHKPHYTKCPLCDSGPQLFWLGGETYAVQCGKCGAWRTIFLTTKEERYKNARKVWEEVINETH